MKYTVTNGRKGSYTIVRSGPIVQNINIAAGETVEVDMTADEAKNAEYPGVDIKKASAPKSASKSESSED